MPAAGAHREGGALHQHPAAPAVARQGARPAGRRALGAALHAPPGQARAGALRRLDEDPTTGRCATCTGTTRSTARTREPSPRTVLKEINGYEVATGRPLSGFARARAPTARPPAAAGSTPAASPTASTSRAGATPGTSTTPRAAGSRPSGAGRGRPTGACSTTARPPTRRASRGRSARSTSGGTRSRASGRATTCPDFPADKRPDYRAPDDAEGMDAISGDDPFIMMADGRGLAVLAERPARRADADALRADRVAGRQPALPEGRREPRRAALGPRREPAGPAAATRATRSSASTFRLTEHHTAGADEPQPAVARRAAAGDVRRDRPGARGRARDRGRRLDDDRDRARRDRGAREGDAPAAAAADRRTAPSTRSRCRGTGAATRAAARRHRRRRQRPRRRSPATPTCRSRTRRSAARCAPGGAADEESTERERARAGRSRPRRPRARPRPA